MNEEIKNFSPGKWYLSQELKEVSHAEISQIQAEETACTKGLRPHSVPAEINKSQEASMPGTQCVEGQQGRGRFLGLVVAVKAW